MALGFRVKIDTPQWIKMIREKQHPIAEAAVAALRDVAAMTVQEGRADIAAAGPNFAADGPSRLQYRTFDTTDDAGGPSLKARAVIFHKIWHCRRVRVRRHHARPPVDLDTDHARGANRQQVRQETYIGHRQRARRWRSMPTTRTATVSHSISASKQVVVPKKFHITEIAKENWQKLGAMFYLHLKDN